LAGFQVTFIGRFWVTAEGYYSMLNAALDVRRDARREDRDGEEYRILELSDLDVAIGVPVRVPPHETPLLDGASYL
jgi:hypothetical protein